MPKTSNPLEGMEASPYVSCPISFDMGEVSAETSNKIRATITSEDIVTAYDQVSRKPIDYVLPISAFVDPGRVPLVIEHKLDAFNVIGSASDFLAVDDRMTAELEFAVDADARAESILKKMRGKHIRDVSAATPMESIFVKPGKSYTADNGRTYTAGIKGLLIATRWTLTEVSAVGRGANQRAKVAAGWANPFQNTETKSMKKELRAYLEAQGLPAEATEPEAKAFMGDLDAECLAHAIKLRDADEGGQLDLASNALDATPKASAPAPVASVDPEQINTAVATAVASALEAENQRVADIRAAAADAIPAEIVDNAIRQNLTVAQASGEFLKHLRENRAPSAGHAPYVNTTSHEVTASALSAAMVMRAGLDFDTSNEEAERTADVAAAFVEHSLYDIARECARIDTRGNTPTRRSEVIAAAVSGGTMSNIFSNVVNAQLMQRFEESGDTTLGWTRETETNDFKTMERTGVGKAGHLKKVASGGKAEHTSQDDFKEEYKISRYGEQFVVDEQDIINDRFNALLDMPIEMADAAARLRPDLVYSILLANGNMRDSTALFDTGHGNYNASSGVLGATTLQASITGFRKQTYTNDAGETVNLNIFPEYLIVPPDLEWTARQLLNSAEIREAAAANGTRNVIRDLNLKLVVDSRLTTAGVTDPDSGTAYAGSATHWFLAANAMRAKTIEVAFLAGSGRRPTVRSTVLNNGQWGIGFDIKHDIGAKALDWRGLRKDSGTA